MVDLLPFIKRTYRRPDIAAAAGLKESTLASWLHRHGEHFPLMKGESETTGSGVPRDFSWYRLMNIATVAELNQLGIPPSVGSSRLALKFSDMGGAKRALRSGQQAPIARLAGGLFPEGTTTYLVIRNFDGELDAVVTDSLDETIFRLHPMSVAATSVVVVNMNQLVARVIARLKEAEA